MSKYSKQTIANKADLEFKIFVDGIHNDALITTNLQGYINNWYPGAIKLFGYSSSEAVGKNITSFSFTEYEDTQNLNEKMLESKNSGKFFGDSACINVCGAFISGTYIQPMYKDYLFVGYSFVISRNIEKIF